MSLTEINIREKEFHNELQSKKNGRFENIFYKSIYNINEDFFSILLNEIIPSQNPVKNNFILLIIL